MPPKKRRLSTSAEDENSTQQTKRKKRPTIQYDPMEFCQELYETVRNHKTEDGRLLCEPFIRVPKRRSEPEYYDAVTQPIDILKIQHKLKSEEYEDIEQLTADIELMVNNAKAYYKKTTPEYKDACDLWDLYMDTKNILMAEVFGELEGSNDQTSSEQGSKESTPPAAEDDQCSVMTEDGEESQFEQLFSAVFLAKDGDRFISEMFKLLPSRTSYPEYYEIIKNPIDLKIVAQKIVDNEYNNLDHMFKDLLLIIGNARTFNVPGSQIYKDAVTLKKLIVQKKNDIETMKPSIVKPTKSSQRIRKKQAENKQKLSEICAALQYDTESESASGVQSDNPVISKNSVPGSVKRKRAVKNDVANDNESEEESEEEEDEEEEEEESEEEEEGPYWQVFNTVKNYAIAGVTLSEPFMRLPNRRFYPDYFEEIKHPLSLLNIQKKVRNNQYRAMDALVADLEIVFENAKQYNIETSRLYKDAVKLQGVVKTKVKEVMKTYGAELLSTPKGRRRSTSTSQSEETPRNKPGRKPMTPEDHLRKRLRVLYTTVLEYEEDDRKLIDIFMVLPSKKDYPDYYHVISEPLDMTMIDEKIKTLKYTSEHALVLDFELMFNNARHYNEESSQVYKDAETLEKVLRTKVRSLPPLGDSPRASKTPGRGKTGVRKLSPLAQKLDDLYHHIKDYEGGRGRILSTPFVKLPAKAEYPDYYEIIKKPIDMQKVSQRMMAKQYESLEDMVSDFVLIFDNACKYNEPDSLIYKDALTLQRVCLEKKAELSLDDDSNEVPDIRSLVQELMTNLFITTFNHTDEDNRCYSDSFQDMPTLPSLETEADLMGEPTKKRRPTFEQVKRNLDRGRYRRADRFQEDMFEVFEYARKASRSDSQLYEDSVELQLFFIKTRDELCRNGETLLTPALSYEERHLQSEVDAEKKEKIVKEAEEDEKKQQEAQDKVGSEMGAAPENEEGQESVIYKDQTYNIGDYVYIEPRDKSAEPHIVCIEKMWTVEGEQHLYGCWFYRPKETYHLATRKFLEKEVFKSDFNENVKFSRVMGKCFVMIVRDYFKYKPEGFADKDVFVCESRYSARHRAFKKIKIWPPPRNNQKLVPRDKPLPHTRIASVFAKSDESDDESEGEFVFEKKREPAPVEGTDSPEGLMFYEQLKTPAGWFKLGDHVYVRSDEDTPYIARIDKIWTNREETAFFHGPWFVHPTDVEHSPTRLFYKHEVFRSSIEDTNPMLSIQGRCAVLTHKEYTTQRQTEIPEIDTYICESKYVEGEKAIKKIPKATLAKGTENIDGTLKTAIKRWTNNPKVVDDEILFFKKPIVPTKEPSPLLQKLSEEVYDEPDEPIPMDTSFAFNSSALSIEEESSNQGSTKEKRKSKSAKPWQPSGYLVFSAECRKKVQEDNPDLGFGEISKVVGSKFKLPRIWWRELPKREKTIYEDKAKKIAEEHAAKQEAADKAFNESLSQYPVAQSPDPRSMSPAHSVARTLTPGPSNLAQSGQGYSMTPQQQQSGQFRGYPLQNITPNHNIPHQMHPGMGHHPAAGGVYGGHQGAMGQGYQGYPNGYHSYPSSNQGYPGTPINHSVRRPGMPGSPGPMVHGGLPQPGIPHSPAPSGGPHHPQGVTASPSMQKTVNYQRAFQNYVRSVQCMGSPPAKSLLANHRPQMALSRELPPELHGIKPSICILTPPGNRKEVIVGPSYPGPAGGQSILRRPQPLVYRPSYPQPCPRLPIVTSVGYQSPNVETMSPRYRLPTSSATSTNCSTAYTAMVTSSKSLCQGGAQQPHQQVIPQHPPSPMFVSVPPRTQRLLHSEAYLKYIEGLTKENKSVGNWEKQLTATMENTPLDRNSKLPTHWLANGPQHHGDTVKALWALRDLMVKDALTVQKTLEFSEL